MTVVTGGQPGPTVAFVAGVHGGKVAAVRALEELGRELPASLRRGRVILLAPANVAGFRAGLAQLSPDDSLNLNRVFPGNASGRPTERLAARVMAEIVSKSDYLVDLHGSDGDEAVGSFVYVARPGLNPPVDNSALQLARAWQSPVIVRDEEGPRQLAESRYLQTAAHLSNVPAITVFEAGSSRDDSVASVAFHRGALAVLEYLDMLLISAVQRDSSVDAGMVTATARAPVSVFTRRVITSAPSPGRWDPRVLAGAPVLSGELLGLFTTSTGVASELRATEAGLVLHQRKGGDVSGGTPLIIAGAAVPRRTPPTRP